MALPEPEQELSPGFLDPENGPHVLGKSDFLHHPVRENGIADGRNEIDPSGLLKEMTVIPVEELKAEAGSEDGIGGNGSGDLPEFPFGDRNRVDHPPT